MDGNGLVGCSVGNHIVICRQVGVTGSGDTVRINEVIRGHRDGTVGIVGVGIFRFHHDGPGAVALGIAGGRRRLFQGVGAFRETGERGRAIGTRGLGSYRGVALLQGKHRALELGIRAVGPDDPEAGGRTGFRNRRRRIGIGNGGAAAGHGLRAILGIAQNLVAGELRFSDLRLHNLIGIGVEVLVLHQQSADGDSRVGTVGGRHRQSAVGVDRSVCGHLAGQLAGRNIGPSRVAGLALELEGHGIQVGLVGLAVGQIACAVVPFLLEGHAAGLVVNLAYGDRSGSAALVHSGGVGVSLRRTEVHRDLGHIVQLHTAAGGNGAAGVTGNQLGLVPLIDEHGIRDRIAGAGRAGNGDLEQGLHGISIGSQTGPGSGICPLVRIGIVTGVKAGCGVLLRPDLLGQAGNNGGILDGQGSATQAGIILTARQASGQPVPEILEEIASLRRLPHVLQTVLGNFHRPGEILLIFRSDGLIAFRRLGLREGVRAILETREGNAGVRIYNGLGVRVILTRQRELCTSNQRLGLTVLLLHRQGTLRHIAGRIPLVGDRIVILAVLLRGSYPAAHNGPLCIRRCLRSLMRLIIDHEPAVRILFRAGYTSFLHRIGVAVNSSGILVVQGQVLPSLAPAVALVERHSAAIVGAAPLELDGNRLRFLTIPLLIDGKRGGLGQEVVVRHGDSHSVHSHGAGGIGIRRMIAVFAAAIVGNIRLFHCICHTIGDILHGSSLVLLQCELIGGVLLAGVIHRQPGNRRRRFSTGADLHLHGVGIPRIGSLALAPIPSHVLGNGEILSRAAVVVFHHHISAAGSQLDGTGDSFITAERAAVDPGHCSR